MKTGNIFYVDESFALVLYAILLFHMNAKENLVNFLFQVEFIMQIFSVVVFSCQLGHSRLKLVIYFFFPVWFRNRLMSAEIKTGYTLSIILVCCYMEIQILKFNFDT